MLIIHHRRNSSELLKKTPTSFGVEIDVRSDRDKLIVQHDPYIGGITLNELLQDYRHQLLVVNVKEEGLEDEIKQILKTYQIEEFFFLDQSFPFLIRTAKSGESRSAVRISEYESYKTALRLEGLVRWCWIDYFTSFPLNKEECDMLRGKSFRLCLVSPELQGYSEEDAKGLASYIHDEGIHMDAVCTKVPDIWQR